MKIECKGGKETNTTRYINSLIINKITRAVIGARASAQANFYKTKTTNLKTPPADMVGLGICLIEATL